jgi:predicted chitinase
MNGRLGNHDNKGNHGNFSYRGDDITTVTGKSIAALVNMATMAEKFKITATVTSAAAVALVTESNIRSAHTIFFRTDGLTQVTKPILIFLFVLRRH